MRDEDWMMSQQYANKVCAEHPELRWVQYAMYDGSLGIMIHCDSGDHIYESYSSGKQMTFNQMKEFIDWSTRNMTRERINIERR